MLHRRPKRAGVAYQAGVPARPMNATTKLAWGPCVLRCLTFELSCTQRHGATAGPGKMGRSPSPDWTARHAVGCQLERRVRQHCLDTEFARWM